MLFVFNGNTTVAYPGNKIILNMSTNHYVVQPWIFTEIKEQRHWDISSGERLKILKDFVHFGLEHWGSDTKGVVF